MASPYKDYNSFKSAWNQSNTSLDSLILKVSKKSLADYPVDLSKIQGVYSPTAFREIEQAMWKAVKAAENKKRSPAAMTATLELITILENFSKSPSGMVSGAGQAKLQSLIKNARQYLSGDWTHLSGLIKTTYTMLGEFAESQIRESLKSELLGKAIFENVMEGHRGLLTSTNLRGKWEIETPKGWKLTSRLGTPLTDISVVLAGDGGTINISVKESMQKTDIKTLRAYTTNLGNLMRIVFEEAPDDYYGYTFYRVLGRLSGGTGPVREIKSYIAQKNLAEALIGSGTDEINDFIINGKLIPAQLFLKALKEEAETSDKVVKLEAAVSSKPLSDTSVNAAVRRYISQKQFDSINGTQAIMRVLIPSKFY